MKSKDWVSEGAHLAMSKYYCRAEKQRAGKIAQRRA